MNVEDALQMCSAPSPDFTGGEWCYAANTLAEEVRRIYEQLETAQRERAGYLRDFLTARERSEAAEQHGDEMRQLAHRQGETIYDMTVQIASLRHALKTVRAECDLPDHIAEFIGEALESSEGARDVRA